MVGCLPSIRHDLDPAWPRLLCHDVLGDSGKLQETSQKRQKRIGETPTEVYHKNIQETSQEESELRCS